MVVKSAEQVFRQSLLVRLGLDVRTGEQRLDLGREEEAPASLGEVHRLDAEVIATEDDLRAALGTLVHDRERPHAVETREARQPPGLVGRESTTSLSLEVKKSNPSPSSSARNSRKL